MDFGLPNLLLNKVKAITPKGNVADLAFAYFASEGGLLQTKRAVTLDHAKDCARIKVVS